MDCIGCTKCLEVCPTDAIVGAPKFLHTIIEEDCIGCELCIPVCPVDCIEMTPSPEKQPNPAHFKSLVLRRKARLAHKAASEKARFASLKEIIKRNI